MPVLLSYWCCQWQQGVSRQGNMKTTPKRFYSFFGLISTTSIFTIWLMLGVCFQIQFTKKNFPLVRNKNKSCPCYLILLFIAFFKNLMAPWITCIFKLLKQFKLWILRKKSEKFGGWDAKSLYGKYINQNRRKKKDEHEWVSKSGKAN